MAVLATFFTLAGGILMVFAGLNWIGVMVDWMDNSILGSSSTSVLDGPSAIQVTQVYTQLIHWTLVGFLGVFLTVAGIALDKLKRTLGE